MEKLNDLLKKSTDIFALDESELGCTDVVCHKIEQAIMRQFSPVYTL